MSFWRMRAVCLSAALVVAAAGWQATLVSQTAVAYRFSFPEPQHHWMTVDAQFTGLPAGPLELRMSRSSPGR